MARALDLTEEQQGAVKALRLEMREEMTDVRAALKDKRAELGALWKAEAPDRSAILAKMAELGDLRQAMRTRKVDFRLAVHALLSPEQRVRAAELFAHHGPGGRGRGHGKGHGKGHGAGFGPPPGCGPGGGPCSCDSE